MHPIERLEERRYFAASVLDDWYDVPEREQLLGRMTNLPSSFREELGQSLLTGHVAAFDASLLHYMRDRRNVRFFFDSADAPAIAQRQASIEGNSIGEDIGLGELILQTQKVSGVPLVEPLGWNGEGHDWSRSTLHSMNRHSWWYSLAVSARANGTSEGISEVVREMESWSTDNQSGGPPTNWASLDQRAWWFDTAVRLDTWIWTYQIALASDAWTARANSVLLHQLGQQGDYLYQYAVKTNRASNNQELSMGKALLQLGQFMPEFKTAHHWESRGRGTLYMSLTQQFFDDGAHAEQSPGYAMQAIEDLMDAYHLDNLNGDRWRNSIFRKLRTAATAAWHFFTPYRTVVSLSDTLTTDAQLSPFKARLVFDNPGFGDIRPAGRDLWMFGEEGFAMAETSDSLTITGRGIAAEFPDAGYFIVRGKEDDNRMQITFDAGPKGGPHGHYDLLSLTAGMLIKDPFPGSYDDAVLRDILTGTNAHSTLVVDGQNHAALEGLHNPDIKATGISRYAGGYLFGAAHRGYKAMEGSPTVSRQVYFDGTSVLVVVDRGWADSPHGFASQYITPGLPGFDTIDTDVGTYQAYLPGQFLHISNPLTPSHSFAVTYDGTTETGKRAARVKVQSEPTTFYCAVSIIDLAYQDINGFLGASNSSIVARPDSPDDNAVVQVNGRTLTIPPILFDS